MTTEEIESIVDELILQYPEYSTYYKKGKTIIGFFISEAIKRTNGKVIKNIDELEKNFNSKIKRGKILITRHDI